MAKKLVKIFIVLLAIPLIAAACQGTETGNPGNAPGVCPTLTAAKSATGSDETLDDLILAICRRLIACGVSTTVDSCVSDLNGEDGDLMTDEFGRPEGTTIAQLRADLIAGAVTASASAADACEADVDAVACESVTAAVSAGDLSGAEDLIPSSCAEVFPSSTDASSPTDGGC